MLKGVVSPDDPDPKAVRGRGFDGQFWQCQLDFVPGAERRIGLHTARRLFGRSLLLVGGR